ncbi:hypothetical protein RO3G_00130 [Rhizopus delemar RA 99-880]|uniref:Uncharacterized protein n=1 Tax=Rhizopus delemar (strain RA 99-880 / ATCC MYA-4621 / FGSC 9543 / NRRL 43880) TaxID=246409 RepID=I1BGU6_RHIO9|nr:hypothetical protein RO3G_00130 [Rhizopus delemar RA 99-880]|eukprot:EIE75426.1 hypothetical protein RO3G_00130 [Rhizopus delemar RA 99-880]
MSSTIVIPPPIVDPDDKDLPNCTPVSTNFSINFSGYDFVDLQVWNSDCHLLGVELKP